MTWMHLNLPLVAEDEDIEHRVGDRVWVQKKGEALLPGVYTPEEIRRLKAERGGPVFYTQYQQAPAAATGEILTPEHLQFFDSLPGGSYTTVLSADTAIKTSSSACYSALMIIKTNSTQHFVVDVLRRRLDPKALLDAALDLIGTYGPSIILIEDASSGPGLHSDLKQRGHSSLLRPTRGRSKEERLQKHLNIFAQGRLFIKSNQTWTRDLQNELLRFPYASFDDQVDALSMYLEWASEKAVAKPVIFSIPGHEQRLAARLPRTPIPRKGEHPMRPRRGPPGYPRR
jgi:predicted phage terminase large subunit-like protein